MKPIDILITEIVQRINFLTNLKVEHQATIEKLKKDIKDNDVLLKKLNADLLAAKNAKIEVETESKA